MVCIAALKKTLIANLTKRALIEQFTEVAHCSWAVLSALNPKH